MIQQSPTEERARALLAKIVERTSVGKHGQPTTRSKYGNYPAALYHEAVATLASQAAQPAEADGWVMVPREPTEAMLRAAINGDAAPPLSFGEDDADVAAVWSAMLAATPKAPAPDAPVAFEAWWQTYQHANRDVAGYGVKKQIAWAAYEAALATPKALATDAGEVERNLEAQRQTIEACARVVETSWVIDGHMRERVAASVRALRPKAALATPPAPNDELRAALAWFSGQTRLSLYHYSPVYGDDDDQSVEWRVDRESGSINDREWETIVRGETADAAILAAHAAALKENRRG